MVFDVSTLIGIFFIIRLTPMGYLFTLISVVGKKDPTNQVGVRKCLVEVDEETFPIAYELAFAHRLSLPELVKTAILVMAQLEGKSAANIGVEYVEATKNAVAQSGAAGKIPYADWLCVYLRNELGESYDTLGDVYGCTRPTVGRVVNAVKEELEKIRQRLSHGGA